MHTRFGLDRLTGAGSLNIPRFAQNPGGFPISRIGMRAGVAGHSTIPVRSAAHAGAEAPPVANTASSDRRSSDTIEYSRLVDGATRLRSICET